MASKRPSNARTRFGDRGALFDAINVRLLEALQADPRLSMAELARRVGMSAPAVTERVQRLTLAGVIAGFRLELDSRMLGLPVAAYIRVRPGPGQLARVAELARATPEVVECHRVTGEDCFLVKAHVAAIDRLEEILDRFLAYGQTTSSIVQSSPVPLRPLPLPRAGGPAARASSGTRVTQRGGDLPAREPVPGRAPRRALGGWEGAR